MPEVYECQKAMDEFSGWSIAATHLITNKKRQIEGMEPTNIQKKTHEIETVIQENNRLLKENYKLSQRLNFLSALKVDSDQLRTRNAQLVKQNDQLLKQKKKFFFSGGKTVFFFTNESYRFRLGHMLIKMYQHKFRILVLPFEMLVLGFDMISGRGRAKQIQAMKASSFAENCRVKGSTSYQLGSLLFSVVRSPRKIKVLPEKIRKLYHAKG